DPRDVFDGTEPKGTSTVMPRAFHGHTESAAPGAQDEKATTVLRGPSPQKLNVVTTSTTWEHFITSSIYASNPSLSNVSAAYTSGPDFWLTSSGTTGWVGYGEKDVYRINKASTGARAVRVSVAPGSFSSNWDLKLCVGSASNVPVMPDRCSNAASSPLLPAGDSYVV